MSMTESEATKLHVGIIGSGRKYPMSFGEYMDSIEELKQYRAIGTVSEFRELKEKATEYRYCPTCNAFVCDPRNESSCGDCQTFIDWSEGKG